MTCCGWELEGIFFEAVPWMGNGHFGFRMGLSLYKPGYSNINPGIPYRLDSFYGIASWSSHTYHRQTEVSSRIARLARRMYAPPKDGPGARRSAGARELRPRDASRLASTLLAPRRVRRVRPFFLFSFFKMCAAGLLYVEYVFSSSF